MSHQLEAENKTEDATPNERRPKLRNKSRLKARCLENHGPRCTDQTKLSLVPSRSGPWSTHPANT
jgi:hypothetical protein